MNHIFRDMPLYNRVEVVRTVDEPASVAADLVKSRL